MGPNPTRICSHTGAVWSGEFALTVTSFCCSSAKSLSLANAGRWVSNRVILSEVLSPG